ncbi:hypothetical protein QYM36_017513, partial [Artemia franciscana]
MECSKRVCDVCGQQGSSRFSNIVDSQLGSEYDEEVNTAVQGSSKTKIANPNKEKDDSETPLKAPTGGSQHKHLRAGMFIPVVYEVKGKRGSTCQKVYVGMNGTLRPHSVEKEAKLSTTFYWRSSKRSCKGRRMLVDDLFRINKDNDTHLPESCALHIQKMAKMLKKKAVQNPSTGALQIFNQVRRKLEDEHGTNISEKLPSFMSAKNTIFLARCATYLKEPSTMAVRSHYISGINLIVARDSVEVAHDDEHIFLWCLVGDTLKLKVELFAFFIASSSVKSIYLDDGK